MSDLLPYQLAAKKKRADIEAALSKALPDTDGIVHSEVFDPWADVISGIHGSYSSESDELMIAALEAVRDRKTFEFIDERGFVAEFALYVLSGQNLIEYGSSPRGGWPEHELEDHWQALIDKWKAYVEIVWNEDHQ